MKPRQTQNACPEHHVICMSDCPRVGGPLEALGDAIARPTIGKRARGVAHAAQLCEMAGGTILRESPTIQREHLPPRVMGSLPTSPMASHGKAGTH